MIRIERADVFQVQFFIWFAVQDDTCRKHTYAHFLNAKFNQDLCSEYAGLCKWEYYACTAQLLAYRFIKTATKCKIIGVKPNEAAPIWYGFTNGSNQFNALIIYFVGWFSAANRIWLSWKSQFNLKNAWLSLVVTELMERNVDSFSRYPFNAGYDTIRIRFQWSKEIIPQKIRTLY